MRNVKYETPSNFAWDGASVLALGAGVWPMVAEAMQLPNIIQQEGQTFRLLPKEFWRLDPLGRVQVSGDQGNTWTLTSDDFVLQNDQLYVEDARFHEISYPVCGTWWWYCDDRRLAGPWQCA